MPCELTRKAQRRTPHPRATRNRNDPSGQALVERGHATRAPTAHHNAAENPRIALIGRTGPAREGHTGW
eukprot:6796809-Alexandrium_andersonii.AAC.1